METIKEIYFTGVDVGASTTKAVLINQDCEVIGHSVTDTGADFKGAAESVFKKALAVANGIQISDCRIVSTGYGRRNVSFAGETKTEISCHARGSFHHFPRAHTLIDIGGQDSKIVKVDDKGKRIGFKMNRKCAAGTGVFLEEIAYRLKVPIEELNGLAEKAQREVQLGSFCTVFTATELLAKIREGVDLNDLVKGVFGSVIKRAFEMDPLEGDIVMSGGVVAHNPFFVTMFEERLGQKIFIPPLPQLTGSLGAALFAKEIKQ